MKTFLIDDENNITVFASSEEAQREATPATQSFASEAGFQALASGWPSHRLVDIWNSLTGVTPVRKFTDRKTAVTRIWKAIQSLQPAEAATRAAPSREVGAGRAAKGKAAAKAKGREKTAHGATGAKEAREGSKKAVILDLLRQPDGTTLKDLMAATGWQAHSVRGFISGAIVKKMSLPVESKKNPDGERAYRVTS